jgi:hypothetical protein
LGYLRCPLYVVLKNPNYRYPSKTKLTNQITGFSGVEIVKLTCVLELHFFGFLGPPLFVPEVEVDFLLRVWESAEPATDFDAELVRPSRSTFEAAVAAFFDVTFVGLTWASVLPAALFDAFPVEALDKTLDAFLATFGFVVFVAIILSPFVS